MTSHDLNPLMSPAVTNLDPLERDVFYGRPQRGIAMLQPWAET